MLVRQRKVANKDWTASSGCTLGLTNKCAKRCDIHTDNCDKLFKNDVSSDADVV